MGFVYKEMKETGFDKCEKLCGNDEIKSLTRPQSEPEECIYCRGTGEHHYHDKDGCHVKCEHCNGTGKRVPLCQDKWI